MAPTKSTRSAVAKHAATTTATTTSAIPPMFSGMTRKGLGKHGIAENQQLQLQQQQQNMDIQTRGKRKAENSPLKNENKVKRSALSNLTNNAKMSSVDKKQQQKMEDNAQKHIALKKKDVNIYTAQTQTQVLKETHNNNNKNNNNNNKQQVTNKIMTRASVAARNAVLSDANAGILLTAPVNKQKKDELAAPPAAPVVQNGAAPALKLPTRANRRISNEFNKTEDSLYMSALEDMSSLESSRVSGLFELVGKRRSTQVDSSSDHKKQIQKTKVVEENKNAYVGPPEGVEDFDKLNWNDHLQVSCYAYDIFNYLKSREPEFFIDDYMKRQPHLSKWMRSLLVDWMVEVQETFELNHETLYLAVKIVDLFLCREVIPRDKLQLLGAAALFIACKFDERTPPLVEDFLYICDGAYKHNELLKMEMAALRTIKFDLGIPLSYRFLRRYARCARIPLPTLTLARYILELSLMDYATVSLSDSRLACAALYMALRMHGTEIPWNKTLEYYTGYKLKEFAFIVPILNVGLSRKPKSTVKTIYSKYSHKIFHEVAKVPLMTTEKLFEQNLTAKEIKDIIKEDEKNNSSTSL